MLQDVAFSWAKNPNIETFFTDLYANLQLFIYYGILYLIAGITQTD